MDLQESGTGSAQQNAWVPKVGDKVVLEPLLENDRRKEWGFPQIARLVNGTYQCVHLNTLEGDIAPLAKDGVIIAEIRTLDGELLSDVDLGHMTAASFSTPNARERTECERVFLFKEFPGQRFPSTQFRLLLESE